MKKAIALSFVLTFLCVNTDIGQWLKLPILIHHFLEHQNHKDEHNASFLAFVKSHYNDNNKHADTDQHDEHSNLPFKTLNTNTFSAFVLEKQKDFVFQQLPQFFVKKTAPFSKDFYTSNVFCCIWLPPKLS